MSNEDSFLYIDDVNEDNKKRLLLIRRVLFASLARNAQKEELRGMYQTSLAIFAEFEKQTRHITDPDIIKN